MGVAGKYDVICKYLTFDAEVIRYRQRLFGTLLSDSEMCLFMETLLEKTEAIMQLKAMEHERRNARDNETIFTEFRELLFFTEYIDYITENDEKFREKTKYTGLTVLFDNAADISKEEWFISAKEYIKKTCEAIKDIQSVTVGFNLDAQLGVAEAGIISLNSRKFTTNTLLDKMFSKKVADEKYICIEPLGVREMKNAGVSLQVVNTALYNAMGEIVGKSLKKVKNDIYDRLSRSVFFLLDTYEDMKFISMCLFYTVYMQSSGMPLCVPEISDEYKIESLYNPNLVGNMQNINIVRNDVSFDDNGKIFVLTGANSGGKTVYLRSVGIAQILFQVGLPIPASRAKMQICTEIFSHFASKVNDAKGGRFENECENILKFYKEITENSLVILDEMFLTTGSSEGTVIACRVLKHFAQVGCKCIYTTNMNELAGEIDKINENKDSKSKVDGLSAEVINGNYTYRVRRVKESYGSYAEEICRKYGFDF